MGLPGTFLRGLPGNTTTSRISLRGTDSCGNPVRIIVDWGCVTVTPVIHQRTCQCLLDDLMLLENNLYYQTCRNCLGCTRSGSNWWMSNMCTGAPTVIDSLRSAWRSFRWRWKNSTRITRDWRRAWSRRPILRSWAVRCGLRRSFWRGKPDCRCTSIFARGLWHSTGRSDWRRCGRWNKTSPLGTNSSGKTWMACGT
ncbi:putative syntaxin binding protein [Trypanosoma cruzi]|uniref:Putative syntaxin binding protein n=1 Tax=Trypanosoma cruzi TaxID=5693 RepID=A0A2V2UXP8_TRYCR|nr:putative syntaxin binding protein [Trypanosoma cruzi]